MSSKGKKRKAAQPEVESEPGEGPVVVEEKVEPKTRSFTFTMVHHHVRDDDNVADKPNYFKVIEDDAVHDPDWISSERVYKKYGVPVTDDMTLGECVRKHAAFFGFDMANYKHCFRYTGKEYNSIVHIQCDSMPFRILGKDVDELLIALKKPIIYVCTLLEE